MRKGCQLDTDCAGQVMCREWLMRYYQREPGKQNMLLEGEKRKTNIKIEGLCEAERMTKEQERWGHIGVTRQDADRSLYGKENLLK